MHTSSTRLSNACYKLGALWPPYSYTAGAYVAIPTYSSLFWHVLGVSTTAMSMHG